MKRFDRRKRLLSQKRKGSFDPNQYYLERDKNSRALRKIRVLLRKMEPVSLVLKSIVPKILTLSPSIKERDLFFNTPITALISSDP